MSHTFPAWQAIDTAPRDGTKFLALLPDVARTVCVAQWNSDRHAKTPRPYFELAMFGVPRVSEDRQRQPIAWMPLPSADTFTT